MQSPTGSFLIKNLALAIIEPKMKSAAFLLSYFRPTIFLAFLFVKIEVALGVFTLSV